MVYNTPMILSIDTSDSKKVVIALSVNGKEDVFEAIPDHRKSQAVLPMIDTLLARHNAAIQEITAIKVHTGPGSFTGLRVGIAIANTLGYLLQVPVNDKKAGEQVDAIYS